VNRKIAAAIALAFFMLVLGLARPLCVYYLNP